MPAYTYSIDGRDSLDFLFIPFSLNPNEEWANTVEFFAQYKRKEEIEFKDLCQDMVDDHDSQYEWFGPNHKITHGLELEDRARIIFDNKFIWLDGGYKMSIKVKTEDEKSSFSKKYRFTIYESDTKQLKKNTDRYKFGDGIYWDSPNPFKVVHIRIEED